MNYLRSLNKLLIYRSLLSDELLLKLMSLEVQAEEYQAAAELLVKAEELGLDGDLAREYVFYLLASGDNLFSRTAERTGGMIGPGLAAAVEHDVQILRGLFKQELKIFKEPLLKNYLSTKACANRSLLEIKKYFLSESMPLAEAVAGLCQHYKVYGYGMLADYMAFKWDAECQRLVGINSCDEITFDNIIGYERQKDELRENTEAFLQGLPANNVLLYGQRGTGKSSSIKALVNKYFSQGLRLVEISRQQFIYLPEVMGKLKNWGKKFILYLDDLSFEEFETEYKQLKSIIDGGLEARPDNVLIYATSNRRNIIKEVWADNEGEELHRTDTINEKVSLADRFGLKIFFMSPDQQEYFNIISQLARKRGLNLSEEELKKEALKWEMSHTGRSGRVAEQLITYLAGKTK